MMAGIKDLDYGDATAHLANLVVSVNRATLPEPVVHAAKRVVLDTLACAVGAVDTEPGRAVLELKRGAGGRADSTLIATGTKVPIGSAAYAHSQLANVLDADETLLWSHTACAIVMPALAAAEMVGATGADLLAAVVVGFDVANRVGFSMPALELDPDTGSLTRGGALGFSWASYGTAAAVGKLLGLDARGVANAFGIAHVSMPPHGSAVAFKGLSEPWHKYSMYAAIAEAGVNGALLAQKGYVSDSHIFDEGSEFYHSLSGSRSDRGTMLDGLGERWLIADTALKPWPCCRYVHGAVDAFDGITRDHGLKRDDIDSIRITVPTFPFIEMIAKSVDCADKLKIMTSLPYCLAMVAAGVPAGPKWWDDAVFGDPAVHEFARKVTAETDTDLQQEFVAELRRGEQLNASRVPVRVVVEAKGDRFSAAALHAKGDPADPSMAMTDAELTAKVVEFTSDVLPQGAGRAMSDAAFGLDSAPNVYGLMEICAVRAAE